MLDRELPAGVRVAGELSNLSERTHWYFALKDEEALISCVMFASSAKSVRFAPADGQAVIATGTVNFYPRQGRTQLYVTKLELAGEGELERRYRELVAELREAGAFEPARKRALPVFPRGVGVVTSKTGAALQDVLDTLRRRCPAIRVVVIDVRVQGERSAGEIVRAIARANDRAEALGLDALVLTRGGGSLEDLWAFNERAVAESVLASKLPVVAAIGHETDTTIAELVADERAATPTQAAMRVSPDRAALREQLETRADRLDRRFGQAASDGRAEAAGRVRELRRAWGASLIGRRIGLSEVARRLAGVRPEAVYAQRRLRIARAGDRLGEARRRMTQRERRRVRDARETLSSACDDVFESARARLTALERELSMVGPMRVLARGYSVTTAASGGLVRQPSDAPPGSRLRTRVLEGTIESVVKGRGDDPARDGDSGVPPRSASPDADSPPPRFKSRSKPRRSSRRRRGDDGGQLGLF